MEGTIGEIRLWASNFAPKYWSFCDGRLVPVRQYTPLFALIGTIYGGDGVNTFGLPDLCGRVAVGPQAATDAAGELFLGEMGGIETIPLSTQQIPAHHHVIRARQVER